MLRRLMLRWAPRTALARLSLDHGELGRLGERLAERHLKRLGDRVRARRLRTRFAEVDLLSLRRGVWCCVEVKTGRSGPRFSPGSRLGRTQLARLRRAAAAIARSDGRPWQVDLIEVCLDPGGRLGEIRHHEDIRLGQLPLSP